MARVFIEAYSQPRDAIFDPFVGSGVVALESLIAGREIVSCDVNPYAVLLTKAKLFAPSKLDSALSLAEHYLQRAEKEYKKVDIDSVPDWVRRFFHPKTLLEIVALSKVLKRGKQYFLLGCLLGILHHQRPGFLSYPASHAVPYLRTAKFPEVMYPELYQYRAVRPRLLNKILRVYRRFPSIDPSLLRRCYLRNASHLQLPDESVDLVVTSPPYMNALDYIRDNRLRLWFLGYTDEKSLRRYIPNNIHKFEELMYDCLEMVHRILRSKRRCVMVVGEVKRSGRTINTAKSLLDCAEKVGGFVNETMVEDSIPKDRRVRRSGSCTRREWILVFRKRN